jgi:hypothetical protein
MRQDYRVVVKVLFSLDLAADSVADAHTAARGITREVFAERFSRAERVEVMTQAVTNISQGKPND